MRRRAPVRMLVVLAAALMLAAACSSSKSSSGAGSGTTAASGTPKKGGSIVLGAEQWPDCLNPITQCANSSWMFWTTADYIFPKLMEFDKNNNFIASPLLVEAPTIANGGIQQTPFQLTFKLNPKAVWDDGTPITSSDIKFTWQAYIKTTGTLSTVGYDQITDVDDSNPQVAVIKFKAAFADWGDLFGGNQGVVLKKAAFPGGPDTSKEMQTSYTFSGRPWKLQSWSKDQAVLVRNDKYWVTDDIPYLDQVTFVPRTDQDTEINSLISGEVAGIYPQPSPGFSKKLAVNNVKFSQGGGTQYEGLWINLSKKPLDDLQVRKALMYSVDRDAILQTIIKPDSPDASILNCAGWVPTVGKWCDNTQFADVKYDPNMAKSILQADGWTLGSDGIFAKAGQKLDIEFNTVSGNTRRENLQQLIIQSAKAAGITFHIKNYDRTALFQTVIPHLNHYAAIYAQVASSDPSVTSIYACDQIPSAANQFQGQNDSSWCNQDATTLMKKSDAEVDETKRVDEIHQIGKYVHDDYVWLPFYQLPLVAGWRTDKIAGPVDTFTLSSYANFWNMNKWYAP